MVNRIGAPASPFLSEDLSTENASNAPSEQHRSLPSHPSSGARLSGLLERDSNYLDKARVAYGKRQNVEAFYAKSRFTTTGRSWNAYSKRKPVDEALETIEPPPYPTSEFASNSFFANEALMYVRKNIYKRNFKSSNKLRGGRDFEEEMKRINDAGLEIVKSASEPSIEKQWEYSFQARGLNCDGLAIASQAYLLGRGVKSYTASTDGHTFLIVGDLQSQYLPSDMRKWPEDLVICDPWANIACSAREYPNQFENKMGKWVLDNKLIFNKYGALISPVDQHWMDGVLNRR